YIELDLTHFVSTATCSTTVYKLKIASLKETFNVTMFPDKQGIAVLTQSSIRPSKNVERVIINKNDTISIIDSMSNIWNFPVRPVAYGSSLYNAINLRSPGDYAQPIETKDVTIGVKGNPPIEYTWPFMSEAKMVSPTDWAIELDALQIGLMYTINPPCTVSRFRMQIGESSTLYDVKAFFDTNRIAVIRLSDIMNGDTLLKKLPYPITTKLLDSAWNQTLLKGLYWRFTLRNTLDTNYSYIKGGAETTLRTSIGTRTTYITQHILNFVNEKHEPLSNVYLYAAMREIRYISSSLATDYVTCVRLSSVVNLNQAITVSRDEKEKWCGASLIPLRTDTCINPAGFTGSVINLPYLDKAVTVNDTFTLVGAVPVVQQKLSQETGSVDLIVIKRNENRILFSAFVNKTVSAMTVGVFTLDGKLVETLSFGPISSPGTYTCEWNRSKWIQSGTYICRLTTDGIEWKTLKLTL
ncbi:MAG TPA: hypothetical protein VKO63_11900, partial [Chitinispirillaceae bacterium]|nr:hypothetical protein [Chitinispirillaceae bacterium]